MGVRIITTNDKLPLIIKQGADFLETLIWKGSDGQPIDVTNYTAKMVIRDQPNQQGNILYTLLSGTQITIGGINGEINLHIPNADTVDMKLSEGYYNLKLKSLGGIITDLVGGPVTYALSTTLI